MKDNCKGSRILYTGLACLGAATAWTMLRRKNKRTALPQRNEKKIAGTQSYPNVRRRQGVSKNGRTKAAEKLYDTAAVLAASVVADSALEHYRGCFFNSFMYAAPTVASVVLAESALAKSMAPSQSRTRDIVFGAAVVTGISGFFFHLYNVGKREGAFSFHNLFYGAPLGAPGALFLSGLSGLSAERLGNGNGYRPTIFKLPAGRFLAGLSVFGLLGTVAEVLLLHFRGAFQDRFMYLPVTIPPVAAGALAAAAREPGPKRLRSAAVALEATFWMGLVGAGFHAYGIQRNMGGWRNWSQMILQGPPLPAPPGFSGVALAGLAATEMMRT